MARQTTTQDYSSRLVDLSIFPDLKKPEVPARMAIGPVARVIAGPAKACQKFLTIFMTEVGSDRVRPEMGTGFPKMLRTGQIFVSPGQIEQVFNVEAAMAVNYLRLVRPAGQPLDEIITRVSLSTYTTTKTGLSITAKVYLADDSTVPMTLPVVWQQ